MDTAPSEPRRGREPMVSDDERMSDLEDCHDEDAQSGVHANGHAVEDRAPTYAGGADEAPAARRRSAPSADDTQLAAWIDAIVDQDERALRSLYDATFSRVYGIVHRIVRRAALADEVVEDTYFQVWRQAVRFEASRGNALTWLLSMARSRAIDALRREARFEHDALDDDDSHEPAGDAPAADELLDIARHHAELQRALMLLGAQPRQLVSLAFFRGLSHEEIASQTSLPLGTVKSQIRRALLAMREVLGDAAVVGLA
jgi:RNA polymerase sigma factor (sigma-70 family)